MSARAGVKVNLRYGRQRAALALVIHTETETFRSMTCSSKAAQSQTSRMRRLVRRRSDENLAALGGGFHDGAKEQLQQQQQERPPAGSGLRNLFRGFGALNMQQPPQRQPRLAPQDKSSAGTAGGSSSHLGHDTMTAATEEELGPSHPINYTDDFSLPSSTASPGGACRDTSIRNRHVDTSEAPLAFAPPSTRSSEGIMIEDGSSTCSSARTADERDFEAQCQVEIERLHSFLVEWFLGAVPKTRREFAQRASQRFSEGFHVISPRGEFLKHDELVSGLYDAWGTRRNCGGFDMRVHNCCALWVRGGACMMKYEEWQHFGEEETLRVCTALFRMVSKRRSAVEWVHLHETFVNISK